MSRALTFIFGLVFGTGLLWGRAAVADCDPVSFAAADVSSIAITDYLRTALSLTISREQYEALKSSASALTFGSVANVLSYDQIRQTAEKEAQASNFLNDRTYYSTLVSQRLSPAALQAYSSCLEREESPGLRVWFQARQGDYVTLNAVWIGDDLNQGSAKLDQAITDNMQIIDPPSAFIKGRAETIIAKIGPNPEKDAFLGLTVGGRRASIVILKQPTLAKVSSEIIVSEKKMSARSGGTSDGHSPFCQRHTDQDCLTPRRPGGYLVQGSGNISDARQAGRVGFTVTKDTAEQICIEVWAATGACETEVSIEARATAIERFPAVPPTR